MIKKYQQIYLYVGCGEELFCVIFKCPLTILNAIYVLVPSIRAFSHGNQILSNIIMLPPGHLYVKHQGGLNKQP